MSACALWDLGILFPGKKRCGFFPFWLNECVLNCNLDVYTWLMRKCEKIRDFKILNVGFFFLWD